MEGSKIFAIFKNDRTEKNRTNWLFHCIDSLYVCASCSELPSYLYHHRSFSFFNLFLQASPISYQLQGVPRPQVLLPAGLLQDINYKGFLSHEYSFLRGFSRILITRGSSVTSNPSCGASPGYQLRGVPQP